MTTLNMARPEESAAIDLTEVVILEYGDIYRLAHRALSIRVLSGAAWITSQAKDHILETGDPLRIPRQPYPVVVSALDYQSLSFELRRL